MAYVLKMLEETVRLESLANGTGTGTLYVRYFRSQDGTVDCALIFSTSAPSTTDTFNIGSLWVCIVASGVKAYIKTAAGTWTVIGAQS